MRPSHCGGLFFYHLNVLTNVYIDGLNLYHRAVRDTAFRWLDLRRLAEVIFPADQIQHVYYFTARVKPRSGDAGPLQRQDVYLRALETLNDLTIEYGKIERRAKKRYVDRPDSRLLRIVMSFPRVSRSVRTIESEEKQSDVNLATRLLSDGFSGRYDKAVVISNDSDLVSLIRCARNDIGAEIVLVNPDLRSRKRSELHDAANESLSCNQNICVRVSCRRLSSRPMARFTNQWDGKPK